VISDERRAMLASKWWIGSQLLCCMAGAAPAEPLDLRDATPRAVRVAFESSGPPGALDAVYSEPVTAWLDADPTSGQVRVRVPGSAMEELLATHDPVPGSFGDYVWTFDAATGEVLSAGFHGRFLQTADFGLFQTRVETAIDVSVGTRRAVGFHAPYTQFGQVIVPVCEPGSQGCTRVAPAPLDPRTGYVNAVGTIRATALGGLGALTFAPLGEAVFSEQRELPAVSMAAE
jgi:hypothetical protein